jgi:hypothetical protein
MMISDAFTSVTRPSMEAWTFAETVPSALPINVPRLTESPL